jgi:sortase A
MTRQRLGILGVAVVAVVIGLFAIVSGDGPGSEPVAGARTTTTTTEPSPVVAVVASTTTTAAVAAPPLGQHLATLRIPKIGVDQPVVEGTTADQLAEATGHYVGTALPGQHGNIGIAGHRTTHGAPFNRLDELVPGDQLVLTVDGVDIQYAVSGSQVVKPTDIAVLDQHGDDRVTLTTCHPKHSARTRLIITAMRVPDAVAGAGAGQSSNRASRAAALE